MTDEELLELDPRKMTEEEVRIVCIELLQDDLFCRLNNPKYEDEEEERPSWDRN